MIVGSGLLAQAFARYQSDDDTLIFASGVSDSLESKTAEYERETTLLKHYRQSHPEAQLVYFSTCSVVDPDRQDSAYVQHKIKMESALAQWAQPYLCLRLPAVLGPGGNNSTLPYQLRQKIQGGKTLRVWSKAWRYLMDVDDIVAMASLLIAQPERTVHTYDLALRSYPVSQIITMLEDLLATTAVVTYEDRGGRYDLDLQVARELAGRAGINYDEGYLYRVLEKYFSPPGPSVP